MPQEWLDNGIPGNWLAVDEDGGSLIPDGTSKDFKASRKVLDAYLVLQTDDRGVTWSDVTSTYETALRGAGNTLGSQTFAATRSLMIFYRTAANPLILTGNSIEIFLSQGYSTAENNINYGLIGANLINKVLVGAGLGESFPVTRYTPFRANSERVPVGLINHDPISTSIFSPAVVAVKTIPFLSVISGELWIQLIYKELKRTGTSWGDDNQFNIVDNQSTVPDNNSQTVIVGQKRVALPYHFDGDLY